MATIFRPAMAADTVAAVPLIVSSGPEAFAYVFGEAEEPVSTMFADGAGEFGFRNHVVGEMDGRIVAVGAGFTRASALPFLVAGARQIVAYFGLVRGPGVILRGLRVERVIRPPGTGEFYIGHLGVDPAWRGRGIGEALVGHLLEAGGAAGLGRAVLDVAATNPRAQALYARLGFRVTGRLDCNLRRGAVLVPGQLRMERAIGG